MGTKCAGEHPGRLTHQVGPPIQMHAASATGVHRVLLLGLELSYQINCDHAYDPRGGGHQISHQMQAMFE